MPGSFNYDCKLGISYIVNAKPHSANIITNDGAPYYAQSAINITYDKTNPSNVTSVQLRSKTIGFIFAGVGICMVIKMLANFYLSREYTLHLDFFQYIKENKALFTFFVGVIVMYFSLINCK